MASELTVTLLRFGFLALLWVFVFVILAAQRRDLGVGQGVRFTALPRRRRGRTRDAAHTAEGTAPAGFRQQMPPAPQLPGQLVIVDGPEAAARGTAAEWFERSARAADGAGLLAEEAVPFSRELSAMVARRPSGETRAWPVVESIQVDGVCDEVIAPAPGLDPRVAAAAQEAS